MTGSSKVQISVRTWLSALVLGAVLVSAGTVNFAWRSVAGTNSRALADKLGQQVVQAVRGELSSRLGEAEASFAAVRTILTENVIGIREADRREFVFLSQIQSHPALSWVAFGWNDGSFFGSHRLGNSMLEMVEVTPGGSSLELRKDTYLLNTEFIEFQKRQFIPTQYNVLDHDWFRASEAADAPAWFFVNSHPEAKRGAAAFAGPVDLYGKRQGVLAVMIELNRLSRFLSQLDLGNTGAAFILAGDGSIVAGPDPEADEVVPADFSDNPYLPLIREVGGWVARGQVTDEMLSPTDLAMPYVVYLAPLGFQDWRVAVAIHEDAFLGPVRAATRRLGFWLAAFVVAAAAITVAIAGHSFAGPLSRIAGDLARIENFDLAGLEPRTSQVHELNSLSRSLIRTANGLGAFGKYIPRDLVRKLVAEGIPPRAGGESRELTVMFADVAGFTGLAERLGPDVVPVISRFLELVAAAIERNGGTVDKFIGDAVMAFWGAPHHDANQAENACKAALDCLEDVHAAQLVDDDGRPLRIRIGLHSGNAVVGNVGSDLRLSYTALGDTVNLASRLEGANKLFGTSAVLSGETRALLGESFVTRELDRVSVYGRSGDTAIYELLEHQAGRKPEWAEAYEEGLSLYRARRWDEAAITLKCVLALRPTGDVATERLLALCREHTLRPPPSDWSAVHALDSK
jgi:adenylate cyclase